MLERNSSHILKANQPHCMNSLASDQSIEAIHHIMNQNSEPLGLPLNQLNPSQEGSTQQRWEHMDRNVFARFNGEAFWSEELCFKSPCTLLRLDHPC